MSQPAYAAALQPAEVACRLRSATETPHHGFWPGNVSLPARDALRGDSILGSRQITDAFLLLLAVRSGGRFVTSNRASPLPEVPGAQAWQLIVL
jgi:hypothetical protein